MCNIPYSLIEACQGDLVMAHIAKQAEDPSAFLGMVEDLSKKSDMIKIDKFNFIHDHIFECYSQPYKLKIKQSAASGVFVILPNVSYWKKSLNIRLHMTP